MWTVCLRLLLLTAVCLCVITHAQRDIFHAQTDIFQVPKRGNEVRLCGRYLSNMLHVVCNGLYNPMFKKAEKEPEPEFWLNEPASVEEQLPYPLKSLPKASSFLRSSNRQKRQGIYDECCRKSCAIAELRSYCAGS
ncbi:hypothetical protein R5R35_001553 [Gryllus longicercus]|uniref:Insulin-like domain-containing protein n=1 Tax=Gryllus longicercus TaxID=2509291 RepID=A0AAN9WV57_9ORTH